MSAHTAPLTPPIKNLSLVSAGFGGQGVLFIGKIVATAGLLEDKNVSWLPSYGPEMRGGTANCSVHVSEAEVGSPLVTAPELLIAMNGPSYERFVAAIKPGGFLFYDNSLFEPESQRDDITTIALPASALASENDLQGLGNVIMLGAFWQETRFCDEETLDTALQSTIPERKAHLREPNRKALALGKAARKEAAEAVAGSAQKEAN